MKTDYFRFIPLLCIELLSYFCFFSCQSDSTTNTVEANVTENQKEKEEINIFFFLSNVEDEISGNESTIKATINGKDIEIKKARNCEVTEKEQYESMEVPSEAIWACNCWWAGAGNNFYATKNEGKVNFYGKEVYEEMKEEEDKWELLKTVE